MNIKQWAGKKPLAQTLITVSIKSNCDKTADKHLSDTVNTQGIVPK